MLLLLTMIAPQAKAQITLPPGTQSPDDPPAAASSASSASVLADAEDKIGRKDFAAAQTALQKYLGAHPESARALFDSGYLADLQEQPEAAVADYRKAISTDPKQFEARLALGLLLARQGDTNAALEQISIATTLEPSAPNPAAKARAYRALAQLDRTAHPADARQALLEALKISPETLDDTLLTAEIAEASDDPKTAEEAYRRVLAAEPNSSAATAGLAHLLMREQKYADAEPLLRAALARDPDDPSLNSLLASALMSQDKSADAVALLKKLHTLKPADLAIGRMLADGLAQSSDYAGADAVYQQLLTASPQDAELLTAFGQNLIHEQKYPEALAVFQKATTLRPDDGDAWSGLAFAASEAHQYSITLDALSMRSKYLPESPATYFLRATAYDSLHVTKAAADNYRHFLAIAEGKYPDQEWQAKHRLTALGK
jgi:tetratricopeptide (TPR) repeat protein